MIYINIAVVLILLLVMLFAVYIFLLSAPKRNSKNDTTLLKAYAHRGLHGNEIPENSLKAFKAAKDNNYGMELDVQLSKDGKVMVFHDSNLLRMTGFDSKLNQLTLEELKRLTLNNTYTAITRK